MKNNEILNLKNQNLGDVLILCFCLKKVNKELKNYFYQGWEMLIVSPSSVEFVIDCMEDLDSLCIMLARGEIFNKLINDIVIDEKQKAIIFKYN